MGGNPARGLDNTNPTSGRWEHYMANAVIYARYSDGRQREESIEDQVRVCREAASRSGDCIVRVYADKATSGTTTDHRAAFAEMIADSARGEWELVYVYKLDRFARNRYDSAVNKNKLKRNGVRLVSATENIQEGPDGILLEALLEGMAEYYSANLSENVRRGLHGNALKCRHNGVSIFGYRHTADGGFELDPETAPVVRRVFDMYLGGAGMPEIVEMLAPFRTYRGAKFRMNTVSRMLRREQYAGVYLFGEVRVEGGMPAIVTVDEFERVQAMLASRTRRRRDKVEYLLTGRLFDTDGNRYESMSGHGKSGKKYSYYRCRETGHSVRRETLEAAVAGAVSEFISSDHVASIIADMVLEEQDEALSDDIEAMGALRGRLEQIERERSRAIDLAVKTDENAAFVAKVEELSREREAVLVDLSELEKGMPIFEREHVEFWVQEIIGKRDPLDVLVFAERVELDPSDGSFSIIFVFDKANPQTAVPFRGSDKFRMVGYVRVSANTYAYAIRRGFGLLVVGPRL